MTPAADTCDLPPTGPWTESDQTVAHASAATAAIPLAPPGYGLGAELGRGGMGVVYRATQTALNRPVALKVLLAGDRADSRERVRFLAEAEAMAAVRHPHVVPVYDFGTVGGAAFLALEYLPGGSLAGKLKAGPLPVRAAVALVAKVAGGVQAAHDLGIVHRDLKPGNVLLDAAGEPKVTDFGLAKRAGGSDLTATHAIMGTPAYMAPEQARGNTKFVGPAADVYALGVVLFECLTGRPPFTDADTVALLLAVADRPPPGVRALNPAVPRDVAVVVRKCLEKRPGDRHPTAAALADDLQRILDGKPVRARPVGAAERAVKWGRRKPATAAAVALGLATVALGGLAAGATALWRQADAARQAAERATARESTARAEAANQTAVREALADLFVAQSDRRPGWTWAVRERADGVAGRPLDPPAAAAIRDAVAAAAVSADLRPLPPLPLELSVGAAAFSPDGRRLAVGQHKGWVGHLVVALIDPADGRTVRRLKLPAGVVGGGRVQDGVWAVAFAPDGRRLFAGTRAGKVHRFHLDEPSDSPAGTWQATPGGVTWLATSPDGRYVYTLC